jgi:hypothetical protein
MAKHDWKKDWKHLYLPRPGPFALVDVPAMQFLMIDGHGDPNTSPVFQDAMTALYGVAYGLKFGLKSQGIEFSVAPSEGLWWTQGTTLDLTDKSDWNWTLMIMVPDEITVGQFQQVRSEALRKKGLATLKQVRLETYHEGLSVQALYVGPYADEGPAILAMHRFIVEQGYVLNGKHHEIYIGDPRHSAPDKLKTVIRQPVRKA